MGKNNKGFLKKTSAPTAEELIVKNLDDNKLATDNGAVLAEDTKITIDDSMAVVEDNKITTDAGFVAEEQKVDTDMTESEATKATDEGATLEDSSVLSDGANAEVTTEKVEGAVEGEAVADGVGADKDKKKGAKNPLSPKKKKAIIISVVAVVLVVVMALSISLPIFFHYKDMIMVKTALDFDNTDKGKYFVLQDDVVIDGDLDMSTRKNFSINLGKYTLTVKGTLKYSTESSSIINLGNIKKKKYVSGGRIDAGKIEVNAPNAEVNLLTTIQCETLNAKAKKLVLDSANAYEGIVVEGADVALVGNIMTAGGKTLAINNSLNVVISGHIATTASITSSNLTVQQAAQVDAIELDEFSTAQVSGAIKAHISGGAKVAMLAGHKCEEYKNIAVLAIYRSGDILFKTIGCGKVVYIDKYATPKDIIVEERANGKIVAVVAQVMNATNYKFVVDDKEYIVPTNELDITELMANGGAGKHVIWAYAMGNYSFETLSAESANLYVDGEKTAVDYAYTITLELPTGLKVVTEDGKTFLCINKVHLANGYIIKINGVETKVDANADEIQKFDITDKVEAVGAYAIQVSATSQVAEIKPSKTALTSYNKTAVLENPVELSAIKADGEIIVKWTAPANGQSYIIYADGVEIGRTTLNSFSLRAEDFATTVKIGIRAEGHDYYEASEVTTCDITTAQ